MMCHHSTERESASARQRDIVYQREIVKRDSIYIYIYHEWAIPARQSSPTIAIATSKTGTPKGGADVGLRKLAFTPKAGKFPEPAVIPKAGDFGGGRRGGGLCNKYSLFAAQSGMTL